METYNPNDLIDFWFSERVSKLWYNSNSEFDNELETAFSKMYSAACDGELDSWKETKLGCLALIILFDQYPLNVFRNNKKSFATEQHAIDVAEYCIAQKFDLKLTNIQRSFIYMPFMHSEAIEQQKLSIELFKSLNPDNLKFAHHHHDIIAQYGRFPHRNDILGRDSTQAELDYLASSEAFTG